MRRVLIVSAVMTVIFVAVAFPQKELVPASGASVATQTIVVARDLAARSFIIGPGATAYLTLANSANRIFKFVASVPTSSAVSGTTSVAPIAGIGTAGSLGDGGDATLAQFSLATSLLYERSGIAVGQDGTIFVADTDNATIRRIAGPQSTEPGIVRSVAGQWAPRQNLTLSRPMGIALDRVGNLYIADHTGNVLDVLEAGSGLLKTLAQISSPAGVAVTPDGTAAFVSSPENGTLFSVDLRTGSLHEIKGISTQSFSNDGPESSPCSTNSNRTCPAGLSLDGAGNLFVSDSTFGRILRVDAHSNLVSVALSGLNLPGAIAFDEQGRNLYIAEQGLDRIVEAQNLGDPPAPLSISPSSWTFANEPISGVSSPEQFTLTNGTNAAVSGVATTFQPTAPAIASDFSVESTSCLSTLAANASCTINVSFTPTSPTDTTLGSLSSALVVTDANSDSASASLSGTADDYQIQLASGQPQEVSVIEGGSASFHFQVVGLGVFGQNGEQVSIFCPGDTPARSTCTVTPATVSPKTGSAAPFSITIQTSSPTVQARQAPWLFSVPLGRPLQPFLTEFLIGISIIAFLFLTRKSSFRAVGIFALAFLAALFVAGCHHASTKALATPTGPTQILLQGSALNQNGVPLNATRGITVTLDVLLN